MKRKINFKQMFLVDNTFFNKVNNENRISVTNSFSRGNEVLGSKSNECTECDSQPPDPPTSSHRPTTPNQPPSPPPPPPNQPPSMPTPPTSSPSPPPPTSSTLSPPYQLRSPSPPQALSALYSPVTVASNNIKPFESEAHQWIDNVANNMEVDRSYAPVVPQPNQERMDFSPQQQLVYDQPQALQYHQPQPQALQHRLSKPQALENRKLKRIQPHPLRHRKSTPLSFNQSKALSYKKPTTLRSKKPAVEMEQGASALPAPEPTYSIMIPTPNEYSSFICTLCNNSFNTKNALERHNRNIHDAFQQKNKGIKHKETFTCDICYSEFQNKKVLDRHVKNIHADFSQDEKGVKRKNKKKDNYPQKYVKFL